MSHPTHADRTQVRVSFFDGKNQLSGIEVLKTAVVFVKNALVAVFAAFLTLRQCRSNCGSITWSDTVHNRIEVSR